MGHACAKRANTRQDDLIGVVEVAGRVGDAMLRAQVIERIGHAAQIGDSRIDYRNHPVFHLTLSEYIVFRGEGFTIYRRDYTNTQATRLATLIVALPPRVLCGKTDKHIELANVLTA